MYISVMYSTNKSTVKKIKHLQPTVWQDVQVLILVTLTITSR